MVFWLGVCRKPVVSTYKPNSTFWIHTAPMLYSDHLLNLETKHLLGAKDKDKEHRQLHFFYKLDRIANQEHMIII